MKKVIHIVIALLVVLMAQTLPAQADRGEHGWRGGHEGQGFVDHGRGGFEHERRGGGNFGVDVFVGPGVWWPDPWYPYSYYPYYPYYQQPVIIQQPPDIYVQPAPQAETPQYWYYCPAPQGYYPYVKKCPKGWLKVVPPANPPEGEE